MTNDNCNLTDVKRYIIMIETYSGSEPYIYLHEIAPTQLKQQAD